MAQARACASRCDRIRCDELPADPLARQVLERFYREGCARAGGRLRRMVVFGSMARGEAGADSDLDVWVEWDGDEVEGWRLLADLAGDLFLDHGVMVSVHVADDEHVRRLRGTASSFYLAVQEEGLLVEG